jgi:hypothetical protein
MLMMNIIFFIPSLMNGMQKKLFSWPPINRNSIRQEEIYGGIYRGRGLFPYPFSERNSILYYSPFYRIFSHDLPHGRYSGDLPPSISAIEGKPQGLD